MAQREAYKHLHAYSRYALVNDLNDSLELRAIELADGVAEILLLLEGEDINIRDRLLRLLGLGSWGSFCHAEPERRAEVSVVY